MKITHTLTRTILASAILAATAAHAQTTLPPGGGQSPRADQSQNRPSFEPRLDTSVRNAPKMIKPTDIGRIIDRAVEDKATQFAAGGGGSSASEFFLAAAGKTLRLQGAGNYVDQTALNAGTPHPDLLAVGGYLDGIYADVKFAADGSSADVTLCTFKNKGISIDYYFRGRSYSSPRGCVSSVITPRNLSKAIAIISTAVAANCTVDDTRGLPRSGSTLDSYRDSIAFSYSGEQLIIDGLSISSSTGPCAGGVGNGSRAGQAYLSISDVAAGKKTFRNSNPGASVCYAGYTSIIGIARKSSVGCRAVYKEDAFFF